jgi:hypothetical protein
MHGKLIVRVMRHGVLVIRGERDALQQTKITKAEVSLGVDMLIELLINTELSTPKSI